MISSSATPPAVSDLVAALRIVAFPRPQGRRSYLLATDGCRMGLLLARMPWNRRLREASAGPSSCAAGSCAAAGGER